MAATTYFGNRARAAVLPAASSSAFTVTAGVPVYTPTTVGTGNLFTVDRGFEVTYEWETVELYGTDSIFRQDEAKHTFKTSVSLRGCKFDPLAATTTNIWNKVLRTLNPTSYDGTIYDTNTLALFDVYVYETGSDTPGTNRFSCQVWQAYLENIPIPFPENDFIILDLKFHGRAGKITNDAAPAT